MEGDLLGCSTDSPDVVAPGDGLEGTVVIELEVHPLSEATDTTEPVRTHLQPFPPIRPMPQSEPAESERATKPNNDRPVEVPTPDLKG